MILLNWLVFPVLLIVALVLTAWWLHRRARVPRVILAVAAGFSLLGLLAQILVIVAIRAAGVRNGLPWAVVGLPATVAVCSETFRYLSFRAGRAMRANRTSAGALMAGLSYGGMCLIYASVVLVVWLLRGSWAHVGLPFALGFSFGFAFYYACVIGVELGLATLVVLAYRRSLRYLPLAMIAHFVVNCTLALAAYVHAVLWLLLLCPLWAVIAIALVVLVRRAGWLEAPPQDETAAVVAMSPPDVATRPARRSSRTLKAFIAIVMVFLSVGSCLPVSRLTSAPAGPAHVSVPVEMMRIPRTTSVRVLVDVSVGGGRVVPVVLDTGSTGLHLLPDAIGPSAQHLGMRYNLAYLGGFLTSEETRAVVAIGGSPSGATPTPIIVGSITSATKPIYDMFEQIGVKGIMGIAPTPQQPFGSPLVQLSSQLSQGYTLQLAGHDGIPPRLILGRPDRSPASISIPLITTAATYPNGQHGYQREVNLCATVGTTTQCGMTVFDTGAPLALATNERLPNHATLVVPPGTHVSITTPTGIQLQAYTVARAPFSCELIYTYLFAPTKLNTGVGFFYANTVGWDLTTGQMVITPLTPHSCG